MTILEAIIMGIVEGLTEYLPVSSTGHLIITRHFLGLPDNDAQKAFEICIQGGAILAVLGIYFQRVKGMAADTLTWIKTRKNGSDTQSLPNGMKLMLNMIIGFLPAAVLGLLLGGYIKEYLFNPTVVTVMWALGGLVILLYVRTREKQGKGFEGKKLEELSYAGALKVGFMQCIAMCPGVSRSLMTMLGGLCAGLSVPAAVEFSFLLGLITLGAATVHDAYEYGSLMVNQFGWGILVVGTITAWASAVVAVKWMVGYLNKHSLNIFGWYRIAAAIFMLLLVCFAGLNF